MHSKVKFKDFIKQLNEMDSNTFMPDVDRQMMGLKDEYPSEKSTLQNYLDKKYRSDEAPENRPYPLNDFENIAADAFIQLNNLQDNLKIAKTNAVIKNKQPFDPIIKEIEKLKMELVDIAGKVIKIK